MIDFSKICHYQNSIFKKFENPQNYFYEICEIFACFYFTMYKKIMFPIEIKDGREAPIKA